MPRSTALGSGGDPLIWLGLAAAILFFVATGAVAYVNFQTLKADSALVVHSGDTLTALEDVLSTVKDAETGQRGYLLTGQESYLDPYNAAVAGNWVAPRRAAATDDRQSHAAGPPRKPETAHWGQARRAQTNDRPAPKPGTGRGARGGPERSRQAGHGCDPRPGLGDGARGDRSAREAARGNGRRLLEGDRQRHHLQPARTWPDRGRRFSDPSRRGRPTAERTGFRRVASGSQRRCSATSRSTNLATTFWATCADISTLMPALFSSRDSNGPYRRVSTYGVPAEAKILDHFARGDGLLGQAAVEGRSFLVRDVPEGYLAIGSAFGEGKPRHLVISPRERRRIDERRAGAWLHPSAQGRRPFAARADVGRNWHRRPIRQLSRGASELSRRDAAPSRRASGAGRGAAGLERGARRAESSAEGVAVAPRTPAGRTRADEFAARGAGAAARRASATIWSARTRSCGSGLRNSNRRASTNPISWRTCRTSSGRP